MGKIKSSSFRRETIYLLLFVAGGVCRTLLENIFPFLYVSYFIFIVIILMWMNDVRNKVISKKTNFYFTLAGLSLILLQFIKLCKYQLFEGYETATNLMYSVPAFFVMMTLYFMLMLAVSIGEPDEGRWLNRYHLLLIPVVIVGAVMWTNEIHHLFYIHSADGTWQRNIFYYIYYALVAYMIVMTLITFYRKCSVWPGKHYFWIPLIICSVLWTGIILVMTVFHAVYLWYEFFEAVVIFATESCIAIGMFPTCTGYGTLFDRSSLAIELRDKKDNTVHRTSQELHDQDEDTLFRSMDIRGGSVVWNEDISEINELYESISKTLAELRENRDIILAEKEMEKKNEEYSLKSAIYDDISKSVNRKIETIRMEIEGGRDLRKIMMCGVYIKRKANLMLVSADTDELPAGELFLSLKDMLTYIDDRIEKKVLVASRDIENRIYPASDIMRVFDKFDRLLYSRYRSLDKITVTIGDDDGIVIYADITSRGKETRHVIN